ncbi:hypothetical protein PG994_014056 [Apiospora phragmitis]|uniref:Uncharacterized protein n=1 Tax=Apiospora phragmitis TaxID=2905665 RepID=A0ABR1T388_9PEZI
MAEEGDPTPRSEPPRPTISAAALPEEGSGLNSYAARLLKEYGYQRILGMISYRPAVPLDESGHVFEWPPGSGVLCVVHCICSDFTIEGKTLEEIQQRNSSIKQKNEADNRRKRKRKLGPGPATTVTDRNTPAKRPKPSPNGIAEGFITAAPPAMAATPQNSNVALLAPNSPPNMDNAELGREEGGADHISSDDEPMMGKRPRWAIKVD